MRCLLAIAAGFGIAYYFSEPLFRIMLLPLQEAMPQGGTLIYTGLPEAFITYMKVGFWGGVMLASPVIFHQLWRFVAPGLYRHEQGMVIPFVIFSSLLFITGGLFGYFVAFPFGFKFFMGYSGELMTAMPSVKEYFSLALTLLFAFGVIFEMPLVLVFAGKMGIVNARMLHKGRKWAILIIFIVAAVLTPPDVISQLIMAGPLLVLYEVSILLVWLIGKKKEARKAELEASDVVHQKPGGNEL
jgi:sec-independent protein translocase protein TatC